MGFSVRDKRLGRTGSDNLPAADPAFRAKVDNPIGRFDDFEVMLYDDDGIALVPKFVEDLQELSDIVKM